MCGKEIESGLDTRRRQGFHLRQGYGGQDGGQGISPSTGSGSRKYPRTSFMGHAQTVWAHIDRNYKDDAKNLYPSGKVTPGGWTDRYLSDYPNFFGDLSSASGHNGLNRDPEFTRDFLKRHQDKLIFGSDCGDTSGRGNGGWF
jgi:hypothetical protein